MADTVVLVRHGKAESGGTLLPDSARRLTEKGAALLRSWYPDAFEQLLDGEHGAEGISIWASPAVRTMETAAIVCEVLDIPVSSIERADELYYQDTDAILGAICNDTSSILIVVGQNPSSEEAASELTGRVREMAKGEALCLDMAVRSDGKPTVLWDVRPR